MKKIWITGAKGRVGSALTRYFEGWGYKVFPTDLEDCDVSDETSVMKLADRQLPDVIINCAGYTNIAACQENQEMAYKVNTIGARNLAMAAQSTGALLVQLSTDDIFDGTASVPYHEFDTAVPGAPMASPSWPVRSLSRPWPGAISSSAPAGSMAAAEIWWSRFSLQRKRARC